jgi:hypothetical protein
MRHLVFVLLVSVSLLAESETTPFDEPLGLFPSSELVEHKTTDSTRYLVVLGALEKVNHELIPEKSILVRGRKEASTYYLPEARRAKQFECQGRSCGNSSFWANEHFRRAILYGPEEYQYYLIAQRSDSRQSEEGDYIVIYIGERATRKIYVQIEYISQTGPKREPSESKPIIHN